jgi:hypothetical protein
MTTKLAPWILILRYLLFGTQNHHHLPAFHLWLLLDFTVFRQIRLNTLQQPQTEFPMGMFTTAEPHGHLGLVPVIQETYQVA